MPDDFLANTINQQNDPPSIEMVETEDAETPVEETPVEETRRVSEETEEPAAKTETETETEETVSEEDAEFDKTVDEITDEIMPKTPSIDEDWYIKLPEGQRSVGYKTKEEAVRGITNHLQHIEKLERENAELRNQVKPDLSVETRQVSHATDKSNIYSDDYLSQMKENDPERYEILMGQKSILDTVQSLQQSIKAQEEQIRAEQAERYGQEQAQNFYKKYENHEQIQIKPGSAEDQKFQNFLKDHPSMVNNLDYAVQVCFMDQIVRATAQKAIKIYAEKINPRVEQNQNVTPGLKGSARIEEDNSPNPNQTTENFPVANWISQQ